MPQREQYHLPDSSDTHHGRSDTSAWEQSMLYEQTPRAGYSPELPQQKFDRREFLKDAYRGASIGAGVLAVSLAGANRAGWLDLTRHKSPEHEPGSELFRDAKAREFAGALGITTASLVDAPHELSDEFGAFRRPDLLPIYYPDVHEKGDLIETLAAESGVPINVIAMIVSIESGGYEGADSGVATGLFQLIEDHLAAIDERGGDRNDPLEQGRQAMKYYTELCLRGARDFLGLAEGNQSAKAHILAMAMYNAGPGDGAREFEDQYPETQQYMQHASRYFQVMEIAGRLRDMGYDNRSIVEALRSPSVDARAYALQYTRLELVEEGESSVDIAAALDYLKEDSLREPATGLERLLKKHYGKYRDDIYEVPLHPASRIHTAMGGSFVLGDDYLNNADPEKYYDIP